MRTTILACLPLILTIGCNDSKSTPADSDTGDPGDASDLDLDTMQDSDVADVPADDEPDAAPDPVERALLVDADLLHHSAWLDLDDAASAAGIELTYRRFFPHVTRADIEGDDAYDMIIVAAGGAPGMSASRLSFDEVDEMVDFVQGGGILVLLPQPTRLDAMYAENDWFMMNRALELMDSSMRIERASLIGRLYLGDPDPPHIDNTVGYSTLLEFDMGYAFTFPVEGTALDELLDGPVPGGRATALRTFDTDVEVLLTSTPGAYLYINTYGSTVADQLRNVTDDRPVAGIEQVGEGHLAIVPRYLVSLTGAGGQISEHPALSTADMTRNTQLVQWLVHRLKDLGEGCAALDPVDPTGGDDRAFWVAAPGIPALGDDDIISNLDSPQRRLVPATLPAGDLDEAFVDSDPTDPAPAVALFGDDPGRIGYGSMSWDPTEAATVFSEASAMGLSALNATFTPERLATGELTTEQADDMRAKMIELADIAEAQSARWLVGSYYTGHVYNRDPSSFPYSIGSQGQAYGPPLLYDPIWDDFLIPAAVEVATVSADHEGIAGILIDMEMYGSVLTYTDAQSFDDTTWMAYVDTVTDIELHDMLAVQPVLTRLDTLIDEGLLGDYITTLEDLAAEIGTRYREAVHALDSDFVFVLYFPGYPTAWQYRGFIRGLGSVGNPVILMSYDPWSRPARANQVASGTQVVHLGGPILSHFPPADLITTLGNCDDYSDGFWYYSHDEISTNGTSDLSFGTREEYRTAITTAAE